MDTLTAISENIIVLSTGQILVVSLAFAARSAKVAFFAFTAAANTGRVMGVVDGTEVATDLSPAAGD